MQKDRFRWPCRPAASDRNIIKAADFRFTVLTSRLIRMEYSPSGDFVDQASQKVFFRDFDACDYRCDRKEGFLFISTDHLEIKYRIGQPFSRDTLKIKLKSEPGSVWHFSDQYDDLGGTVRTLDCVDGPITLGRGLISRRGFAVMVRSSRHRPVFFASQIPAAPKKRP